MEKSFATLRTILALGHVDQHVDEVVEVRVELDGVHKIARDAARHVVQSGVRSAEAAQWRRGHHCGVVWPRGIPVGKVHHAKGVTLLR